MLWFWGRLLTSAEHARCCRDWQLWRSEGTKDERVLYAVREREREGQKRDSEEVRGGGDGGPRPAFTWSGPNLPCGQAQLCSSGRGQEPYLVAKPSNVHIEVAKPSLLVICFVGMRSTELGCFRWCSWCLWKALDEEGCMGLVPWRLVLPCKSSWILKMISSLKIKLNHNWKFRRNWVVPLGVVGKILMSRI